jgi:hypothetical protein
MARIFSMLCHNNRHIMSVKIKSNRFSWLHAVLRISLLTGICITLVGCSSGESKVDDQLDLIEQNLAGIRDALNNNGVRNATIIRQYASLLKTQRPERHPLLVELEKDATIQGPLFKGLEQRLKALKDGSEQYESWTEKLDEATRLRAATQRDAFNDALSDTVNVIADLSDGTLARVNAMSASAEQRLNSSKSYGKGSQYIGNPHYGNWSHGSGGSFWAWYGQYAFFSSMFGNNRHYYNDWGSNRGYSYYHDVGRNHYTSRSQRNSQRDVDTRARKQFGSQGKYKSPYAKSRGGSTGLSSSSKGLQNSAFKSQYGSSRKTSKYQSSSRTSGFRTSRGVSRGK